jgi:ribonucleoside-diphosphate reductase alpha chain
MSSPVENKKKTAKPEPAEKIHKDELRVPRFFTQPDVDPYDEMEWEKRSANITNERGEAVFEQNDVEMPKSWTQLATNVVVSKYFKGTMETPERESSLKQIIDRVADTITSWGWKDGYFLSEEERDTFQVELKWLLVNQYASFNSPVWFNVGIEDHPQCSACFILSIEDKMDSILGWYRNEGMIFKYGSGSGVNLSPIRSSKEHLSGGGTPSGPVSFMKAADTSAGTIKSGGKTRRAAKMVVLNSDHPDIKEFIHCKSEEEKKAHALIEQGYDPGFNVPGGAYDSVYFQNANNSVRVTDEFMQAVVDDKDWYTKLVTTGDVHEKFKARDLMGDICDAAWFCGDPGLQMHDTTNHWHTCLDTEEITASNPCSEYVFLNDTACNLSSLNLMKFRNPDGSFGVAKFRAAAHILILAQEIIVDNASYPTKLIGDRSNLYRTLGLGYANLGALLMSLGLPYDSDEGRAWAAAISALMTGQAYLTSAEVAGRKGAFPEYDNNSNSTLRVLKQHRDAVDDIDRRMVPDELFQESKRVWDDVQIEANLNGVRNAQVTVLAPTGTISFMMDCDTTGVEPDIALVKYKKLVGGGMLKIVNNTVPMALNNLGYDREEMERIIAFIDENDTIEGAPDLKEEHLPVFDCAFRPANGQRSIHYMGHVRMMGAAQPFLSGAISKTVNLPADATTDDIQDVYVEGWKLGLKAIAIYRDGCKRTQPLSTSRDKEDEVGEAQATVQRRRLPDERNAVTHKFSVAGHEGYITAGLYENGLPGEIFITMSKEGSTISGVMDAFATSISLALQYGVPLKVLSDKFSHMRFEPAGFTGNPKIPMAKSLMDYIFRWLALRFLTSDEQPPAEEKSLNGAHKAILPKGKDSSEDQTRTDTLEEAEKSVYVQQADAPLCTDCGSLMIRNGACYKCANCGSTSGCS